MQSEQQERIATPEVSSQPAVIPHKGRAHDYAYYRQVFQGREMPFAFVDLDLLNENIRQTVARASRKRVRLASKSLRSVAILRRILAADAVFQGIMSYSAREAVFLARQGFADLLLGYPIWQEQDIAAVAKATAWRPGSRYSI